MKPLFSFVMMSLAACGLGNNDDDVDVEAAEAYVGNWEIATLASQNDEEIENPVEAQGDLGINEELEAEYGVVFVDGPWAYEIEAKGKVVAADEEEIENELEGIIGRVPIAGGEPEVLEFLGVLECQFTPGGLVCAVFGVAQNEEAVEFDIDLEQRLERIDVAG